VNGFPGYTYFVDQAGNVTWVTIFGPPGIPSSDSWATTGGDWYYLNMNWASTDPSVLVTNPAELPAFLNPDDATGAYASFSVQLINAFSPQQLPQFPPPPNVPPTLQNDDPADNPGNDPGSDPGTEPPSTGDLGGSGSSDTGIDDTAGGGGDPGGGGGGGGTDPVLEDA
jgi:hypothetical protein